MSRGSLTPGKAIIAGSVIIACGIVAAAFILPEQPAPAVPSTAALETPKDAAPGRFQIVRVEGGRSWRLDTVTGEMTVCRLEGDRMICAKSSAAIEVPRVTADQLEAERAKRRAEERRESTEILDRFFAFFERILRFAERQAEREASPAPPTDDSSRRL
jgi:hypothetical protein